MAECRKTRECCLTCGNAWQLNRRTYGGWDNPEMVECDRDTIGFGTCVAQGAGYVNTSHSLTDKCPLYVRDNNL